jgi:hypothetical protein
MLEERCDFKKVTAFDDQPSEMLELHKMDMPEDFWQFYRETDGGIGQLNYCEYGTPCTLVLYGYQKMKEMKKWFLWYSAMLYEELYLLDERKPNEKELERLHTISDDLVILGQCGDPDWPDYLFCYRGTFFLMPKDSLDFPFTNWTVDEDDSPSGHSYFEFLTKILEVKKPFKMKML